MAFLKEYQFQQLCFHLSAAFSIDECSFVHQDEAVIFSPARTETWLCRASVYDCLVAIAKNKPLAQVLLPLHELSDQSKRQTFEQLADIGVLELKEVL